MNGESGTSKTGAIHNYYTCYTRKRKHACDKKPLKKDWIEYIVAQDAMELLTDDTIQELADMAISQTEQDLRENTRIPELTDRMKETESGITNITKAIEKGIASDALMNRLVELEKEKKNLLRLLAEEEKYVCKIERSQIVYWLTEFKGGRIEDERYRRIIIDLMINSVTVWDEPDGFRITTAYNLTSCKSKTFRIAPSGEKGFGFEGSECTRTEHHDEKSWCFVLYELHTNGKTDKKGDGKRHPPLLHDSEKLKRASSWRRPWCPRSRCPEPSAHRGCGRPPRSSWTSWPRSAA